jgi:hypothetical protein
LPASSPWLYRSFYSIRIVCHYILRDSNSLHVSLPSFITLRF